MPKNTKRLRPFFSYYGAKWRLSPYYPIPTYDMIVEPFAGSACYSTYYFQKKVILYDIDPIVFGVWDYLIRSNQSEILSLPSTVDYLEDIKCPIEAKWLIGFWLGRGLERPALKARAWMNRYGGGEGYPGSFWCESTKRMIASQLPYIKHWKIINSSYHECKNTHSTWFVDPPYNNKAGKSYAFKINDYRYLANWCQNRNGQVIVCENEGADWLPFTPFREVKATNGKNRANTSKEAIWTNDPGTTVLTQQGLFDA